LLLVPTPPLRLWLKHGLCLGNHPIVVLYFSIQPLQFLGNKYNKSFPVLLLLLHGITKSVQQNNQAQAAKAKDDCKNYLQRQSTQE